MSVIHDESYGLCCEQIRIVRRNASTISVSMIVGTLWICLDMELSIFKWKKKKNGGKRPKENVSDFQELICGFFQSVPPWIMTSSVTNQGRDEILLHTAQLWNYFLRMQPILYPNLKSEHADEAVKIHDRTKLPVLRY
ncbi:hypothetical protein V6N13_057843 [Hibiscus sabdariffa]|uniref:Uncharacterized protein n=1 Tax=Hibiscus sabdariffa TaxID=183260 RepID=A0ABR2GI84_9ROSI